MSPVNGSIIFSLLLTIVFLAGLVSFLTDYETGKCEMTYMFEYPQFVRISHDVDLKHKKYGLYAYSEGRLTEKARNMVFDGIPVLFIPGSGGSHKQCRSFASIALRKALNSRTRYHFDYFTIDLNNELSGLNGALLQEQLDYVNSSIYRVLELYHGQRDVPKSVILIGHSMGGVLAKAIISQLPSNSQLIPIVIALSAPITRPVLALDYFFERFYSKMNDNFNPPDSTAFITIAGGFNDFLVPPYLTEGGHIHTVATQIPKSWVSTDHLSVVWCKQLVLAVNRALFESIDPQTRQVYESRDTILDVFHHHLIQHSGTNVHEFEKYFDDVQLTQSGEWHEGQARQYSVRLPKGTRDIRWYLIPIVMKPHYEHLTLVGTNMKSVDWVYVCAATSIRNNQRFCETGRHLTQFSEISPSVRYKRRTLRINMHDLKMNHTSATHIAVRVMPTSDYAGLHIDINDPYTRHLIFNYGPSFFSFSPKKVLALTEEKAVHYDILLPQLTQLIQSYTLYLDGVCTGQHHATASLEVPWIHHDYHQFYTDVLKKPMTFKLYKARPANETEYASIRLTLDPTCRYKISMTNNYDLGMMARFYFPMIIANVAAVILMTLRSQLNHIGEQERCSFIFTALKEGVKPYYVITSVKILSRLLAINIPLIGPSDNQILIDENIDVLLLPLVLYSISVGIVWLVALGLSISLICFESTFHKLGIKFFKRTFAGRVGWTDHLLKAFDKIPGVVACVLIAMSYTTCGGLAICLATIFYFLKLTQMAQDLIEDLVKGVAKSIAYKLRDKIWHKVKERWNKRKQRSDEILSVENEEKLPLMWSEDQDDEDVGRAGPSVVKASPSGDQAQQEIEEDEDDDFEKPMEFEIQKPGDPETTTRVDGDKLVELLNSQMSESANAREDGSINEYNEEPTLFDKLNFGIGWIKEAMENNEIFFHFTMFLIYLVVAVLNVPTVLTWARNYKYNKSLVPDPVFLPALILSACAAPLWQLEFPRVEKKFFKEISKIIYVAATVLLIYGLISIYRISYILAGVVAAVTLHQLLAPNKPEIETEPLDSKPEDRDASVEPENDSYNERVKSKWE